MVKKLPKMVPYCQNHFRQKEYKASTDRRQLYVFNVRGGPE